MALVVIGARRVRIGEIAVFRKVGDAACVVVGLTEAVPDLTGEKAHRSAAEPNFQRIALLIALGLKLPLLTKIWVGPGRVIGWRRSIYIERSEHIDSSCANI